MAISDIKVALESLRVGAQFLLDSLSKSESDFTALQGRADSLQDCIDKKNAELVVAAKKTDAANAETEKAEAKLAGVKKALESYKAMVNA